MSNQIRVWPKAKENLFPGRSVANFVFSELETAIEIYENKFKGKQYKFSFSDGTEMSLEFFPQDIAKLLGIDLYSHNFIDKFNFKPNDYINTYDSLRWFVDEKDELIEKDRLYPPVVFNYYKIEQRIEMFKRLMEIDFNNFMFGAIDFSTYNFFNVCGRVYDEKASKVLFFKQNELEKPYLLLGTTVYDEEENLEVPQTILSPYDYTYFFKDQDVILPTSLTVKSEEDEYMLSNDARGQVKILEDLKEYVLDEGTDFYLRTESSCHLLYNEGRYEKVKCKILK